MLIEEFHIVRNVRNVCHCVCPCLGGLRYRRRPVLVTFGMPFLSRVLCCTNFTLPLMSHRLVYAGKVMLQAQSNVTCNALHYPCGIFCLQVPKFLSKSANNGPDPDPPSRGSPYSHPMRLPGPLNSRLPEAETNSSCPFAPPNADVARRRGTRHWISLWLKSLGGTRERLPLSSQRLFSNNLNPSTGIPASSQPRFSNTGKPSRDCHCCTRRVKVDYPTSSARQGVKYRSIDCRPSSTT